MTKPKERVPGVYVITNTISIKFYIGSSNHVPSRINGHKNDLAKGKHCNRYLQAAYNKYGAEAFEYRILELCAEDTLITTEQSYLDKYWEYGVLYNMLPNASSCVGRVVTEETRAKLRARPRQEVSDETRAKMSVSQKRRAPKSEETRAKLREARKRVDSDSYKLWAEKRRGVPLEHSPEAKAALIERNKSMKSRYTEEEWKAIQEKRRQSVARNKAAKLKEAENGNH